MSNQTILVVLDAQGNLIAAADPYQVPPGMAYSIASRKEHSVLEVEVPRDLMKRAHPDMKRIIKERIDAGACKPHRARPAKSQSN